MASSKNYFSGFQKKHILADCAGFTLVETIIGIALFAIVAVAIYFSYANVLNIITISQFNLTSLSILSNELESIRNIPYEQVGIEGGSPPGILPAEKIVLYDRAEFLVKTTVRNIDDPFDGTIGGTPKDLAPADYKLVELAVRCMACSQFAEEKITTTAAPKNLEGESGNGALFINVFDAFGKPVSGASLAIVNSAVNPSVHINDITNVNGVLQLVDIATSAASYEIVASRNGYSSERTYPLGAPGNPNPVKPHATVAKQEVTNISFAIDKTSVLNFQTTDQVCRPVPDVDFWQTGTKLIGHEPDVLKYSLISDTTAAGVKTINDLEWDAYNFQNLDNDLEIGGMFNDSPLIVNPDTSHIYRWLMMPKDPNSVLITVVDGTGQPLNDAKITLSKTGFSQSRYSGRRFLRQTDWSGGQYAEQSGKIEDNFPAGEIKLQSIDGKYASNSQEWLVSSTFDLGTEETVFYNLKWNPVSQPPPTGPDSLKFQLAANNDNTTWNFTGPDGTAGTFYTISDIPISPALNSRRYLRYRAFLKTEDHYFTPTLEDLSIEFHSACLPDGQISFFGLGTGTYTITVEKSGYQTLIDNNLSVTGEWRQYQAMLSRL